MSELAGLGLRADFSHSRVYARGAENYIGEKGKPRVLQCLLRNEDAQMKFLFRNESFPFETVRSAGLATWLDGTLAARPDRAA
jgi:hypothetical protein